MRGNTINLVSNNPGALHHGIHLDLAIRPLLLGELDLSPSLCDADLVPCGALALDRRPTFTPLHWVRRCSGGLFLPVNKAQTLRSCFAVLVRLSWSTEFQGVACLDERP